MTAKARTTARSRKLPPPPEPNLKDALLEALEQKFNALSEGLKSLRFELRPDFDERLRQVDVRLSALEMAVRMNSDSIPRLTQQMSVVQQDVAVLRQDYTEMKGMLGRLLGSDEQVAEAIEKNTLRITRVEERVAALEQRLSPA